LAGLLRRLEAAGCAVDLCRTRAAGDGERMARQAALAAGCDLVVAAGGDGTINEVVNGLVKTGDRKPLPLALLPLGTANVLAAEIGVRSVEDAAAAILEGGVRKAHVGMANGRCFTMMVGAGFDAHVVRGVDPAWKRRLGKGAYGLEMLRQMARYPFGRYSIHIDGAEHEAASVIVAKGHYYGGRYVCAPAARLDDPLFQVCLFERGGRRAVIRYALALGTGRLAGRSDYRIVPGRTVRIEGPASDPVQGDGEMLTRLPADITLSPQPLLLRCPLH
jgi:YegS/Rv2252/BmrU family lipid kinase